MNTDRGGGTHVHLCQHHQHWMCKPVLMLMLPPPPPLEAHFKGGRVSLWSCSRCLSPHDQHHHRNFLFGGGGVGVCIYGGGDRYPYTCPLTTRVHCLQR
jgi:hypothetical protein